MKFTEPSLSSLADISFDWSDHALWWPAENIWLLRTRSTLDQYGVQADTQLQFTPMHKVLRIQLPDLQVFDLRINFSANVFRVVNKLCKELGEWFVRLLLLFLSFHVVGIFFHLSSAFLRSRFRGDPYSGNPPMLAVVILSSATSLLLVCLSHSVVFSDLSSFIKIILSLLLIMLN